MSATKRSRQRPDAVPAQHSQSQPATKRIKSSHVPLPSGLEFLVDENARALHKIQGSLTNGVPRLHSSRVDESHAFVAKDTDNSGDSEQEQELPPQEREIIAISSGEEESSELEDEEDEDEEEVDVDVDVEIEDGRPVNMVQAADASRLSNGYSLSNHHTRGEQQAEASSEDQEMESIDEEADVAEEPSFGDLLQTRHPEPIDMQIALQNGDSNPHGLVRTGGDSIIPTGHTLGTLLSQALKNNDKDMLETCLAMNDTNGIRATIQRQTSREAAILVEKIAERMHKRPGRTGNLMTWVQWVLVCHGGYLAHQPELMKKLRALTQIVRQRANGLQHLLHLKGKLDLLTAQLELRRGLQQASRAANTDSLDDEGAILYIEGQDEDWSDSDDGAAEVRSGIALQDQESEDEDAVAALPNGVGHASDDVSSEEEDDDDDEEGEVNDLLDMEAEEESGDEEEESSNDEAESEAPSAEDDEDSEDEESDVEAVKQPRPSTLNRKR